MAEENPDAVIASYYRPVPGMVTRFPPIRASLQKENPEYRETCVFNFNARDAIYHVLNRERVAKRYGFFWQHGQLGDFTIKLKNDMWTPVIHYSPLERKLFAYYVLHHIPILGVVHFDIHREPVGHVVAFMIRSGKTADNKLNVSITLFETYDTNSERPDGWLQALAKIPRDIIEPFFREAFGGFVVERTGFTEEWAGDTAYSAITIGITRYRPIQDGAIIDLQRHDPPELGRCVRFAYIYLEYLTKLPNLSEATHAQLKGIVNTLIEATSTREAYLDLISTRGLHGGKRRNRRKTIRHKHNVVRSRSRSRVSRNRRHH